jgi:hypothetical protein
MSENLRGQPYQFYIQDAVLETTTMTSNMSAGHGRFAGGVVNMVTKSVGNEFSGSFRSGITNESRNGETPLTTSQADELNTTFEATFGGYLWRDLLWFFLAGRAFGQTGADDIAGPIDVAHYVYNDSLLTREYRAFQARFDHRLGSRWSFGATYTYSKSEGNFDDEAGGSGPVPSGVLEHQEYKDPAWNPPDGYLGVDQRHKVRG